MSACNIDLSSERDLISFDVEKMIEINWGGSYFVERNRYLRDIVHNDKDFDLPPVPPSNRDDIYSNALRRSILFLIKMKEYNFDNPWDIFRYQNLVFGGDPNPTNLHTAMFIPTITNQCTEEQKDFWLRKIENLEVLGTYAQTELGHGTFIRGLETVAKYDRITEEFVLNTPFVSSYKWWPGGLGKSCNTAIVMAKLIIDDIDKGVHGFIVQLRHYETHASLPGITIGDIGEKFGFIATDTGFLKLENVRIPRMNMLMKNAQVTMDGQYKKAAHNKLAYGTMVFVRSMLVHLAFGYLSHACTIAIRYSCVRRQSQIRQNEPESKIIEYQSQKVKLVRPLSLAYAINFSARNISMNYFSVYGDIQSGNFEKLGELHALSCGLKAYCTHNASSCIEICRMACGGHGYMVASRFPTLYTNSVAACTYEGENTVMYLQCARFLLKSYNHVMSNKDCNQASFMLPDSLSYFNKSTLSDTHLNKFSLSYILNLFELRSIVLIKRAADNIITLTSHGENNDIAWNESHIYLITAAEAHIELYMLKVFMDSIAEIDDLSISCVLTNLCSYFALEIVIRNSGQFFKTEMFTSILLNLYEQKYIDLLNILRKDLVGLTDAFDYNDRELNSVLGCYDGFVYDRIFESAKKSHLNKNDVHDAFNRYIKPIREKAKL